MPASVLVFMAIIFIMPDLIRYNSFELLNISSLVQKSHLLRTINPLVCANIKSLNITRRRRRGKRGGRHVKLWQYNRSSPSSIDCHHDDTQNIVVPFMLLNARSIKAREYLIRDELYTTNAEFAVVTETWLHSEDAQWAECSQFNRDGLKIVTYNRQTRRGGGVALIHSDKHIVNVKESGQKKSFEYLVCTIRIRGTVVTRVIIYHPPYSPGNRVTNPMFIDEISQPDQCTTVQSRSGTIRPQYHPWIPSTP